MPKPELYVIFTGNKGRKPDKISLSREFFEGADIVSDGELREKQTANYFSDIYPIDCAVLSANAQSCPKCCTLLQVLLSA